jgi:hypothetical protein
VSSNGQMAESMRDTGRLESRTAEAHTTPLQARCERASGAKGRELSGLNKHNLEISSKYGR